jgi:DNA uptake protein ComE-like DNA-binding protein
MPNTIFASSLSGRKLGIVTEVIDGEALAIQFGDSNVLIKLIGVNTNASDQALEYVNNTVKGKYVWVVTDDFYNTGVIATSYYLAYVYKYDTGELLNAMILKEGLGELNSVHSYSAMYTELIDAQSYAKTKKLGTWQDSSSSSKYARAGEGTNINTATAAQLKDISSKITSSIASNIISYRRYNPFNTIEEIKYVPKMTKEIYDAIRNDITVVTNINEASEAELLTLSNISQKDVDSIMDYRDDHKFSALTQFYTKTGLSSSGYDANKKFISLEFENSIDAVIGNKVVNVNTASASQISAVEESTISSNTAQKIVNYRKKGYTYKTLMELCEISGASISESTIDKLEDNLHLYTDINNATTSELQSLFGSSYVSSDITKIEHERPFRNVSELEDIIGSTKYDKIKDYIYVDQYVMPIRTNINLATLSQLEQLNISLAQANKLKDQYKQMTDAADLPFDVESINNKISLFTNINTATKEELESLYNMSSTIASDIITYRNEQPFGSIDEVEAFFKEKNEKTFYNYIKDFIVVR